MGDLATKANGKDPSVINGKLKTTFQRVTGCNKLNREIARKNMKDAGLTKVCKKNGGDSYFSKHWREWVF